LQHPKRSPGTHAGAHIGQTFAILKAEQVAPSQAERLSSFASPGLQDPASRDTRDPHSRQLSHTLESQSVTLAVLYDPYAYCKGLPIPMWVQCRFFGRLRVYPAVSSHYELKHGYVPDKHVSNLWATRTGMLDSVTGSNTNWPDLPESCEANSVPDPNPCNLGQPVIFLPLPWKVCEAAPRGSSTLVPERRFPYRFGPSVEHWTQHRPARAAARSFRCMTTLA
jgi:hypothetical protein